MFKIGTRNSTDLSVVRELDAHLDVRTLFGKHHPLLRGIRLPAQSVSLEQPQHNEPTGGATHTPMSIDHRR